MSNVPKLRFKEFSGDWEEKKLGSIATFYNSQRIPLTESDRVKGEYPYYGASGIIDYVNDYIFDGEYILLGEDGANIVLRSSRLVFLAKGKFWVNNHAHVFQSRDSNAFLCEALERINYTKYNTGTAQPKLNSDVVKKIKLNVSSKQEQEKIASFLTSVDTKIEQLTKKEELLKKYKKGVMQKIFSQEIRFKDDDGKEFPKWDEKKLGNVFKQRSERNAGELELLSVTMNDGVKRRADIEGKDNSSQDKSKYLKVYIDDIVYNSMRMWQGANGVSSYNGIVSPAYTVLKGNDKNSSMYFGYLFKTTKMIQIFQRNSQGLTSDTWNLKYPQLSLIKVKVPCLEEQTKIANFLSSLDSKIEQVVKQLDSTKEFKKALLQQMFV